MCSNNKNKLVSLIIAVLLGTLILGCKKLIEVDLPIDKNTNEATFSNIGTAVQAVNGIYAMMSREPMVSKPGISIFNALIADELQPISGVDLFYSWDYNGSEYSDGAGGGFWNGAYRIFIYRINSALDGISKSRTLPDRAKEILSGELKFSRAWMYFLLLNSYGDVPLVLSTDLNVNANVSRSAASEVYKQIEQDLLDAQKLLDDSFLERDLSTLGSDRIRPNKGAATALLARTYLYMGRWADAEVQSSKLIDHPNYTLLDDLEEVFLINNRESIWQLQPSDKDPDGYNAPDGRVLISSNGGDEPELVINPNLLAAFEPGDKRKEHWIGKSPSGAVFAYKYKQRWRSYDIKEYTVVFRLAEQYLIRAEARAKQEKLAGDKSAASDLNKIRHRAGLGNTDAITKEQMLAAIDQERRVELFLEWGDRWFNLKRRNKIDAVMSVVAVQKNANWQSYKALLPIPWDEFKYNPSIRGHQNPGYPEQ